MSTSDNAVPLFHEWSFQTSTDALIINSVAFWVYGTLQ